MASCARCGRHPIRKNRAGVYACGRCGVQGNGRQLDRAGNAPACVTAEEAAAIGAVVAVAVLAAADQEWRRQHRRRFRLPQIDLARLIFGF